jgi:predicted amidophosphoribosyltransferase
MPHHDPDDEDWYDDEDADLDAISCPECGADIYADLDHCPRCGRWLTDADCNPPRVGLFDSRTTRLVAALLLVIFVLGLMIGVLGM